ncbi:hypothetical protein ACQYWQ_07595 [Streptomyces sp. P6-2-1]|uniref:hypothetical protein n=1 Tax=Streptomyces sp. P6-2-1 TaxID=3422591 RepID=UPI003D369070
MAETRDFPDDLRTGQEELHQVRAELRELLRRLPWSVTPHDGFSEDNGWRRVERPATPGWGAEDQALVSKLRAREFELTVFVTSHPYWAEVAQERRVDARSRLKHAATPPTEPRTTEPAPTAPQANEPGTPGPEAAAPETPEPEPTEPGSTAPEPTEPASTAPEPPAPGTPGPTTPPEK